MQFTLNAGTLATVLKQCSRIASKKGNEAERHVLIDAQAGQLSITAFNGSQQVVRRTSTSTLNVVQSGAVCAVAHKLEQIVSSLPAAKDVKLCVADDKLVLTSGRSRFSIVTMDVNSFPTITVGQHISEFEIDTDKLRLGGKAVASCCARDDVRHFLNGMNIRILNGTVTLVGSDGHRMGIYEIDDVQAADASVIVPTVVLDDLIDFAVEKRTKFRIYPNLIAVISEAGELYSKLVDGKFPDFDRISAPHRSPTNLVVNRHALLQAAQRVALMTDKSQGLKLSLQDGETAITSVGIASDGSGEELIPSSLSGQGFEVGFSARYLTEILRVMSNDEICMSFATASDGTHIRGKECGQLKFVLMPMRL